MTKPDLSDLAMESEQKREKALAEAGVPTEEQMRDSDAPWPKTPEELATYIATLVNRPHTYGTCVYAMSLAATAALNYVAGVLGCTGFQGSCADLDILRRTRQLKHGFRILDYDKLLYPQYLNSEAFPSWRDLLADEDTRKRLAGAAAELLKNSGPQVHPDVRAHWQRLAHEEVA